MASAFALDAAQAYLRQQNLDAWLLVDFHHNNPVFWQVIGEPRHTTRRAFLLIPANGTPRFLLHMIDAGRLADVGWPIDQYLSRTAAPQVGVATPTHTATPPHEVNREPA